MHIQFFHTPSKALQKIAPYIEKAYNNVLSDNLNDLNQFFNNVAELHWLLAQAMPYERGSACISEWLISALLKNKGLSYQGWDIPPDYLALHCQLDDRFKGIYTTAFSGNLLQQAQVQASLHQQANTTSRQSRPGSTMSGLPTPRSRAEALHSEIQKIAAEPYKYTKRHSQALAQQLKHLPADQLATVIAKQNRPGWSISGLPTRRSKLLKAAQEIEKSKNNPQASPDQPRTNTP